MKRLQPRDGALYVVRWLRTDGSQAKHRYFRREHDARRLLARLTAGGWTAELYVTDTEWRNHARR